MKKASLAIVDVCIELKAWTDLNENIILLAKRRSQLKQVRVASFL